MSEYLNTKQVAQKLGVRVETVRRWIRTGQLAGTPIGRAGYRIHQEDFAHFVQREQRLPASTPSEPINAPLSYGAQVAMEATATTILERMTDGVLLFSFQERCLYANEGASRLLGQEGDDLLGKTPAEVLTPVLDADLLPITSDTDCFSPITHRWYQLRSFATPQGRCFSFLDVTERKRTEATLRESEQRFRALVTATSYATYCMSPDWQLMHLLDGHGPIVNACEPNTSWLETYIPPDDQPHVMKIIKEAIRTKGIFELEHRVLRADGTLGWTLSRDSFAQ